MAPFFFALLGQCDAIGDSPPLRSSGAQHGERLVIALDDHFRALPHFLQHCVEIARQLGLADVDLRHIFDDTSSRSSASSFASRLAGRFRAQALSRIFWIRVS